MATTVSILTPPEPGAIGVLHVEADEAEALAHSAARAGIPVPAVGGVRVVEIAGVDTGVVIRWTDTTLHLMPHAGPAVVGEIIRRLDAAGITLARSDAIDPGRLYPEARDEVEARMLWALAHAASPLAIDLLLAQPRRWRAHAPAGPGPLGLENHDGAARERALGRLLTPPMVIAIGPPNIGKSTLCNALAGRAVAIVADEPGTTRDHVGVLMELDGLAVRYLDAPGMAALGARPGAPGEEAQAVGVVRALLASADLVLCCGDATAVPLEPAALPLSPTGVTPPVLTIGLRADLARPSFARDLDTSAHDPGTVGALARLIRSRLVPDEALADPRPWKFWV